MIAVLVAVGAVLTSGIGALISNDRQVARRIAVASARDAATRETWPA